MLLSFHKSLFLCLTVIISSEHPHMVKVFRLLFTAVMILILSIFKLQRKKGKQFVQPDSVLYNSLCLLNFWPTLSRDDLRVRTE